MSVEMLVLAAAPEALALLESLLAPILAAVGTVIASLLLLLYQWVKRKIGLEIQEKEEGLVAEAIQRSVTRVMQTFVNGLKASGQFDKKSAAEALEMAEQAARKELASHAALGNKTAQLLLKDSVALASRIEAMIPHVKTNTK